jgi:purine nucleosidase
VIGPGDRIDLFLSSLFTRIAFFGLIIRMTSARMPRPIIIDTDPGQDDAIAILFALAAHDRLNVLGISTVAGNVPAKLASRNARIVLDWANRTDVPVYAGCPRPLIRDLVTGEHVHGEEGLEGVPIHEPRTELSKRHAVNFLIDTLLNASESSITICCIGPLTNLACALIQSPDIVTGIKELIIMGGAYFVPGNITPTAEFNIYVDPHAAAIVFGSGLQITVLPLDVTHKALTTKARIERLKNLGNQAGELISKILTSYGRRQTHRVDSEEGPLHDPCTIGYLLEASLFSGRRVNVSIETASELTFGETVVDWNRITARQANALWITEVDVERFYSLLTQAISGLP